MVDKNPIIRRQIVDEVSHAKFTPSCLVHMAHYDVAARCIVGQSKQFGRPVNVLSLGCGDMWELRVLVNGLYVKKADVLRSYVGVDIVPLDKDAVPLGPRLLNDIKFTYVQRDLMDSDAYPLPGVGDGAIDVVICTEFIEHVDKASAEAALMEIAGMASDGALLYITTPNADNSISSDPYHIYEWKLEELLGCLEEYWEIESCVGTYIRKRVFDKINKQLGRIPVELVDIYRERFSSNWYRVVLAAPYPEYSEGIAIKARRHYGT